MQAVSVNAYKITSVFAPFLTIKRTWIKVENAETSFLAELYCFTQNLFKHVSINDTMIPTLGSLI